MRRPVGVLVAAIVLGLGTLWGFLGVLLFAITPFLNHSPAIPGAPATHGFHEFVAVFSLLALCFFAFCAWTVVGLFRMRPWARYSMIALGVLIALVWGLLSILTIVSRRFAPAAPISSPHPHTAFIVMSLLLLFGAFALVGVWWAVYFSLRHVRLAFAGVGAQGQDATFSVRNEYGPWLAVVTILALFMLLGGIFSLALTWMVPPLPLLGFVLHGKGAIAVMLFLGVYAILSGTGILRRVRAAYWAALAWQIFGLIQFALVLVPGYMARMRTVNDEFSQRFSLPAAPVHAQQLLSQEPFLITSGILGLALSLVFLYARLRCRGWFVTHNHPVTP